MRRHSLLTSALLALGHLSLLQSMTPNRPALTPLPADYWERPCWGGRSYRLSSQTWRTTRAGLQFLRCGNGRGNPKPGDRWARKHRRETGRLNPKKHRGPFTYRPNPDLPLSA